MIYDVRRDSYDMSQQSCYSSTLIQLPTDYVYHIRVVDVPELSEIVFLLGNDDMIMQGPGP